MSESTKTLESKVSAKEETQGSWLYKTTVTNGDRANHDRIANVCFVPVDPLKGLGAENMVILRLVESKVTLLEVLMWSLSEGNLWVAYRERAMKTNPDSQTDHSSSWDTCQSNTTRLTCFENKAFERMKHKEQKNYRTFMACRKFVLVLCCQIFYGFIKEREWCFTWKKEMEL